MNEEIMIVERLKVAAPFVVLIIGMMLLGVGKKELRWNWDAIDTSSLKFPDNFKFCVASAEYQISGNTCFYDGSKRRDCPDSNWLRYEKNVSTSGQPFIEPCGEGVGHWKRHKSDIELIKNLGVSVYRCSLDWSRIQPRENYYDQEALDHYHEMLDELKCKGIKPMVTLHHFVNPGWFEDKGAFEREENIGFFLQFAQRMFDEFNDKVSYWCTINEPGVYAAQTYIRNDYPRPKNSQLGFPCNLGRGMCFQGAGLVTKHLMQAHIAIYKAFKASKGGNNSQVGIVHDIIQFEPYHPGNWFECKIAGVLGHVYCDAITEFLTTGNLKCNTYVSSVDYSYPTIKDVQDFVGLNYYSHVLIKWSNLTAPEFRPEDKEMKTDLYYGMYPEGMYRALKEVSVIGKPIYITENGLADADDTKRELWYKRYLYAVHKAIKEGVDVRMFCACSLMDHFEWNFGFSKKFGLYSVDPVTHERKLKNGAQYFKDIASSHKQAE